MARFGGYPGMGGGNNMNQLLKQAKQMQEDMMKTHSEIEAKEFDVTSGGGAVTVTMTGKKMIKSIKISPDVLDKDDVEMLEDLVMTAVNEILDTCKRERNISINKVINQRYGGCIAFDEHGREVYRKKVKHITYKDYDWNIDKCADSNIDYNIHITEFVTIYSNKRPRPLRFLRETCSS